ncbi:MAG: P-loop NTPase, partial [Ignavibacteriaceae bacterium]
GAGGGKNLADEYGVQFLGSVPIDIDVCKFSDTGKITICEKPNSEVADSFNSVVHKIEKHFNEFA